MFSEQKLPVSTPPEQIWTLRYREQCTKWAGLSTQTAISTESAHQNDLTRCAVYTQYVILRSPRIVPVTNLNEAVPRTFHSARNMNACVPRTCSENILPGFCTENIYERAPCYPIWLYALPNWKKSNVNSWSQFSVHCKIFGVNQDRIDREICDTVAWLHAVNTILVCVISMFNGILVHLPTWWGLYGTNKVCIDKNVITIISCLHCHVKDNKWQLICIHSWCK